MPETTNSEVIESLASKLADFAEGLSGDERLAFNKFLLQQAEGSTEVEGFSSLFPGASQGGPPTLNELLAANRAANEAWIAQAIWRSQRLR